MSCLFCDGLTPPPGAKCKHCGRKGAALPDHTCHARNCNTAVKPEMLMCRKHWIRVPRIIKNAVWDHYRVGQCDDKHPSAEWMTAANAAIGYIAKWEGFGVSQNELIALHEFGFSA